MTSYRLIKTNNTISSEIIKDILNKIGIDLLCVATHYSDRYGNSDNYLNTTSEMESSYALYFTKNTIEQILDSFISQCVEKVVTTTATISTTKPDDNTVSDSNSEVGTGYKITWKNMHYIWKLFLSSINVPNMIYSSNLKNSLKNRIPFIEDGNDICFTNVTSKFLPAVSNFLSFWEKHITVVNSSELEMEIEIDDEYEIDEIVTLYKQFIQMTNTNINTTGQNVVHNISDEEVIKIISHYFSPSVEVIERKYVTNIKCNLWTKTDDIILMLNNYKDQFKVSNSEKAAEDLISFDDLYKSYRAFCQAKVVVEKTVCLIVSKQFFEKSVTYYLPNFIKFDKFVSAEWLLN